MQAHLPVRQSAIMSDLMGIGRHRFKECSRMRYTLSKRHACNACRVQHDNMVPVIAAVLPIAWTVLGSQVYRQCCKLLGKRAREEGIAAHKGHVARHCRPL